MFYFPCPICVLRSYQNPMQRGTPLTNEDDTPTLKPLTHQPYKVSVGASNLLSNETQNSICFFRLWTFPVVDFLFNKKLIVYHSNPTTVASAKKWSPIDWGVISFGSLVQKQVTKGKKTALHLALSKASFAKDGNFGKVVDLASFFCCGFWWMKLIWMKGKDDQEESLIRYFWVRGL